MTVRIWIVIAVAVLAAIVFLVTRDLDVPMSAVSREAMSHDELLTEVEPIQLTSELDSPSADDARFVVSEVGAGSNSEPASSPDATIVVTVAAIDNHNVLEGIRVSAFDSSGPLRKIAESEPTDRSGIAELRVPSGIDLYIVAEEHASNAGTVVQSVPSLRPDERRTVDLYVHRGDDARVFVQVVACAERAPVPHALVQVSRPAEEIANGRKYRVDSVIHEALTDSEGRCELPYPSTRDPYLRVRVEGMGPLTLSLEEPATWVRPHVVCVERAAALVVEVVDASGAPVSEARVDYARSFSVRGDVPSLRRESRETRTVDWFAKTDASGRALIEGLPANVWLGVRVVARSHRNVPDVEFVALDPGERRTLRLTIGVGCRVEGQIVDQENRPVSDAEIVLRRPREQSSARATDARATSDDQGRFAFDQVSPGAWQVELDRQPRKREQEPARDVAAAPMPIHIDARSAVHEVVFKTHRGLFISGRVLDPGGNPLAVRVHARDEDESERWGSTQSDAHGKFRIGPLNPGRYELQAAGSPTRVLARAGDSDVEIEMRVGGSLHVRVVDPVSGEFESAVVSAIRRDTDRFDSRHAEDPSHGHFGPRREGSGDYWAKGLAPGRYDVCAIGKGGRYGELRDVMVQAGDAASDVTIELKEGCELRVHSGEPATGGVLDVTRDGLVLTRVKLHSCEEFVCVVPAGKLTVRFVAQGASDVRERSIDTAVGQRFTLIFGD